MIKLTCDFGESQISGDQVEFKKQVYQTIQSYILSSEEWSRQALREIYLHNPILLTDLIDRVLQDSLRSYLTRILKSEEISEESKCLLVVKTLKKIISNAVKIEDNILGGEPKVLSNLLSFLDSKYKE